MKVAISYAVELEDIPGEVKNLIRDVQHLADPQLLDSIIQKIESGSILDSLVSIEALRGDIAKLDVRLEDCQTILSGFLQVATSLANSQQQDRENEIND